jgi:putative solute:sodium symporter small subunit
MAARLQFWRRVRWLTVGLLSVWGAVTLAACWFAEDLNRVQVGNFPFGFWLSAQGAILVYVGLIAVYAWVMDRWEAALLSALPASDG